MKTPEGVRGKDVPENYFGFELWFAARLILKHRPPAET
jgi:hypothetical protein